MITNVSTKKKLQCTRRSSNTHTQATQPQRPIQAHTTMAAKAMDLTTTEVLLTSPKAASSATRENSALEGPS